MVILTNRHDTAQMIQLFFVVAVCMGYNATVLAQVRPKYIFNGLLISVAMSTILLVINIWLRYLDIFWKELDLRKNWSWKSIKINLLLDLTLLLIFSFHYFYTFGKNP